MWFDIAMNYILCMYVLETSGNVDPNLILCFFRNVRQSLFVRMLCKVRSHIFEVENHIGFFGTQASQISGLTGSCPLSRHAMDDAAPGNPIGGSTEYAINLLQFTVSTGETWGEEIGKQRAYARRRRPIV